MKLLINAFAVLALVAMTAFAQAPTKPLNCKITEPKKFDAWEVGSVASAAWECDTGGIPLRRVAPEYHFHIELGTGSDKKFAYVDTLDHAAKIRFTRFDWILKSYPPGDYVVRFWSKLKSQKLPATQEESDKLPWQYVFPIAIVKQGDKEGLKEANARGDKNGDTKSGKKKAQSDNSKDTNDKDDKKDTENSNSTANNTDETNVESPTNANSATTFMFIGHSVFVAAGAIAAILAL